MTVKRADDNQADIVSDLRRAGCSVCDLHEVGHGCPDLLVTCKGRWLVVEVKDGNKPPSKRKIRDSQRDWHARFPAPVEVWETVEDVRRALDALTW